MLNKQIRLWVVFTIALSVIGCDRDGNSFGSNNMTLQVNGEVVPGNLDQEVIQKSLAGLNVDRDGEGFAILEQNGTTYLQVSGDQQRGFDAEYQEGDITKHFRNNKSFTLDEAAAMMTDYLQGDIDWDKYGTWSKITW